MSGCIFCAIVRGETGRLVWQNDAAVAFESIGPLAPVHLLVVPRQHLASLDELEDETLAGKLLMAVREVAHGADLKGAWKLKVNNGEKAGQTVHHLHFHVLGGREMSE